MQCNAMQCNAMQCNAMQCYAMRYNAILYYAMQRNAMQRYTMQCYASLDCTLLTKFKCQSRQVRGRQITAIDVFIPDTFTL